MDVVPAMFGCGKRYFGFGRRPAPAGGSRRRHARVAGFSLCGGRFVADDLATKGPDQRHRQ